MVSELTENKQPNTSPEPTRLALSVLLRHIVNSAWRRRVSALLSILRGFKGLETALNKAVLGGATGLHLLLFSNFLVVNDTDRGWYPAFDSFSKGPVTQCINPTYNLSVRHGAVRLPRAR
jgi:hypothetical protein